MLDAYGYPTGAIYVAHKRFVGPNFRPGGQWGDILDFPMMDFGCLVQTVIDKFTDEEHMLDRGHLRVWRMPVLLPREDVTEEVLRAIPEAIREAERLMAIQQHETMLRMRREKEAAE